MAKRKLGLDGLLGRVLQDRDHELKELVELALKLHPGGRFTDLAVDGEYTDGFPPTIDVTPWSELKEYGLDHSTVVAATYTPHIDSKIALSNDLIEAHHEWCRRQQPYSQRKLVNASEVLVPESIIDRLCVSMIAASRTTVPSKVLELAVLRLGIVPIPRRKGVSKKPAKQHDLLKLLTLRPDMSNRRGAKMIGVADTTVARWRANREFKETLEQYRELLAKGIEIE